MLLSFTVRNFLSFEKDTTLTMEATSIREKGELVFYTESYQWDYKLLRSVALFGYNSSGKSNLLKAIALMKFAVLYSNALAHNIFKDSVKPFLLRKECLEQPSFFEIIFFCKKRKYRYGFEILDGTIVQEWLFYAEPGIRQNHLFVRHNGSITFNKKWNEESDGMVEAMVKRVKKTDHFLFLSFLGVLQVEPIGEIIDWFKKIDIVESFDTEKFFSLTADRLNNEAYRYNILMMLRNAELGFKNVIEKKLSDSEKNEDRYSQDFVSFMIDNELIPKGKYQVSTSHDVYDNNNVVVGNINFDLGTQESTGTKKFFALIGLLLDAIIERKILLFDELDSQFHSVLYETILTFFNKPTINSKGAQLIFTSHSTHLMKGKKLRRDQIYLISKNNQGTSTLERLHGRERNLRTDTSIEKEYLENSFDNFPEKIEFNLFTGRLDFPTNE